MNDPRTVQVNGQQLPVTVLTEPDDMVVVRLGDGSNQVTLAGTRYDVHRLVIEIDRQLGQLDTRYRAC